MERSTELFEDLLDLLVAGADADHVLSFKLPAAKQERLSGLLEKNREGTISNAEKAELDTFEQVEHVVRLLKARLLQANGSS